MRDVKIAFINYNKYTVPPKDNGAIEYLTHWLSEELVKRGHKVIIYGKKGSKSFGKVKEYPKKAGKKEIQDYVMHTLPSNIDIIHDHTGYISKLNPPIPTVFHTHTPDSKKAKIPLYVSKTVLKNAGKKGYYLHNGIKLSDYPFQQRKKNYLLFLGRIAEIKGVHLAIKVAKKTNKKLIIAGPVSNGYYYKKMVKPYLNKKIQYIGPVSGQKKIHLLKNAECLVFPTNWKEPFGLVMIEAMACGTPVVALKRGSIPELFQGMKGSICLSTSEMARIIKKGDFPAPEQFRRYIEKHYTIERMTNQLLKIYKHILRKEIYLKKKPSKS